MIPSLPHAPRRATVALAALALAAGAAGCGTSDSGSASGDTDPAGLVARDAPLYVEANVKPGDDVEANLDAVIRKVAPGQSLSGLTQRALDQLSRSSTNKSFSYARDVKPWLGDKVALALTGPGTRGDDFHGVVIADATDDDKAMAAIKRNVEGKAGSGSYQGVDYITDTKGLMAAGIVDDALVVGDVADLKRSIDASKGESLGDQDAFKKTRGALDDKRLGFFYVDLPAVVKAAGSGVQGVQAAEGLFAKQGLSTIGASVSTTGDAIRVDAAAPGSKAQPGAGAAQVASLPAGALLALGVGDLGRSLSNGLASVKQLGGSGPANQIDQGLRQLKDGAGIDVQKDLFSWMGDAGLFVRGASLTDVGGALVVKSTDPAATKAALAKARTIAAGAGLHPLDLKVAGVDDGFSVQPSGLPVEVDAALAGDRFILAAGQQALTDAIKPAQPLSGDPAFTAGAKLLPNGTKPSFFLDFKSIASFVELAAGSQPGFAKLKPTLDALTTIVTGSEKQGDTVVQHVAVGVR